MPVMRISNAFVTLGLGCLLVACGDSGSGNGGTGGDGTTGFPVIEGALRTPDAQFENLPDYDFEPHYMELGLSLIHI